MKKTLIALAILAGVINTARAVEVDDGKCYLFANSAAAAHSMAAEGTPLWNALDGIDKSIIKATKKSSKASIERMRAFGRSSVLVGYRGYELGKDGTETYALAVQACQMSNGGGL